MTVSFDLTTQPWVPCVDCEGRPVELGLAETLARSHELRELAGESPLVTAALHRLLLAILHRVFGPAGYAAWYALWEAGRFDAAAIDRYLTEWRERFDLFHPTRPFYQAADARVKPKSVSDIVSQFASGNTATLFDHHTDDDGLRLTPSEAARAVVTAQSFGLAMSKGSTMHFTDGTCTRGVLFLVQGTSLFETLVLNLLPYDADSSDGFPHNAKRPDRPAWEMDDAYEPARTIPNGYLDYLTWQSRRIRLIPEATETGVKVKEATMGPGLALDAGLLDPMKQYRRDEKYGNLVLRFVEDRVLWRDSAVLLRRDTKASRPPLVFGWLSALADEELLGRSVRSLRVMGLGMCNEKARIDFYRQEHLSLPVQYLRQPENKTLLDDLDTALEMAEGVKSALKESVFWMALLVVAPTIEGTYPKALKKVSQGVKEAASLYSAPWGVERRYWSRLELPFRVALERLPQDREAALTEWRKTLVRIARDAFEAAAEDVETDARRLKAAVEGRGQLAAGLAKALPPQGK